ncbi:MAG: RIP metalloprotease [Novosphingobium sp.]|nr:RIP metalloprotease [Novosphingobium sp.]
MPKRGCLRANCWSLPDLIDSPSFLFYLFGFLLLLGPLIVIHELGHYLAGRWCGVRAETFSVGFGKELWHRIDKRGTRWRIAALPLGGYVQFAGDADASSRPDAALAGKSADELKGTMPGAPLWQRSFIVLAGPLANLLTAVLIFAGFAMAYGVPHTPPVVGGFAEKSAAQAAGIQVGDRITAVDGAEIESFFDISQRVALYPGETVDVTIDRAGRTLEMPVKLMLDVSKDEFGNEMRRGLLGIAAAARPEFTRVNPLRALQFGVTSSLEQMRMMAIGLKQIVFGERSVREMGGLPKVAKFSGEMLSLGWLEFAGFAALISINLAFINLLPIPTLDGGHLAMYAAEAVRRKPLGLRSQELAFRLGMAFVLAFAVFVNLNDLAQMFL